MSFTSSTSDSLRRETASPAYSSTAAAHAAGLLDIDRSLSCFPRTASPVSSASRTLSPTAGSRGAAKTNDSAPIGTSTHPRDQMGKNGGRWTEQEHQNFLVGLRLYGREWKKVAAKIKTRTSAQIRSHAQKYFAKIARDNQLYMPNELSTAMAGPVGYFSDGGSSIAQNSGDDDANTSDTARQSARTCSANGKADRSAALFVDRPRRDVTGLYQGPVRTAQKRSRATETSFDGRTGMKSHVVTYPHKLYKRESGMTQVEGLPSQEELLAKVSPKLRHRLSSLIEAELCALQVLSCYGMQQQNRMSTSRQELTRQRGRYRPAAATASTTRSSAPSSLGISMLSTEHVRSTSSIY